MLVANPNAGVASKRLAHGFCDRTSRKRDAHRTIKLTRESTSYIATTRPPKITAEGVVVGPGQIVPPAVHAVFKWGWRG